MTDDVVGPFLSDIALLEERPDDKFNDLVQGQRFPLDNTAYLPLRLSMVGL